MEEKKKTFQIPENDEDLDELEEINEEKEKEKVTSNYRFFYVKKLIFTFYFVKSSDHMFPNSYVFNIQQTIIKDANNIDMINSEEKLKYQDLNFSNLINIS